MRRLAPLAYLLLAFVGHAHALASITTRTSCACRDSPQTDWFLGWTPHALGTGTLPWTTDALDVPHGVNLMWNTLMPLPGLLAWPVTATAGVLAAHTVLSVLSFACSATAMWWAVGRWAAWGPARFAAGLLYGFSPYLVAQGSGHLNLTLVALLPVLLVLLDELLVRQRRSPVLVGGALALVALGQLLTTEEVLASTAVVCALGLAVLLVQQRAAAAGRARHAAVGLLVAAAVLTVLAAEPLLVQFRGPQRVTAPVQDSGPYAADLLGTVVPTIHQLFGTPASTGWGGNPSENGSYLGAPLLVVLALLAWQCRRVPVVRLATVLGLLVELLALGTRLHVAGHDTGVPLPFALLHALPVFSNVAAVRLSLHASLLGAVVLAVGLDRVRPTWRSAWLAALCAASLLPAWPYPYQDAGVPVFFSSALVRQLPAGSVALTYPVPRFPGSAPMLWQAESGYRYRSLGGYVITPTADGAGTFAGGRTVVEGVLAALGRGAPDVPSASRDATVRDELRLLHVRTVLVARTAPHAAAVSAYVARLLGERPVSTAGSVDLFLGPGVR